MSWLLVAIGGALGAVLRDLLQRRLNPPTGCGLPRATLLINLAGAFLLGLVVSWARHNVIGRDVAVFLGAGFCGAFTTWSGFMWEWLRLSDRKRSRMAWGYLAGSLVVGIALAGLGLALG